MPLELTTTDIFTKWLAFTEKKSVMECDFFNGKHEPVLDLFGEFSIERMLAFGEHASGSVISFYSMVNSLLVDEVPVAWLDSEGSPCIVISKNLREFLSVLPYGMGTLYSIASVMENNLGEDNLLEKAKLRVNKSADILLSESKERFINTDILINWLSDNNIQVSNDPVKIVSEAHLQNSELTTWLAENLKK